jgi:hypothetical protein
MSVEQAYPATGAQAVVASKVGRGSKGGRRGTQDGR